MPACLQVEARALASGDHVVDSERQADINATDVVNHSFEAAEIELDDIVNIDAGLLLHGLAHALRAARRERGINPLDRVRVGRLASM